MAGESESLEQIFYPARPGRQPRWELRWTTLSDLRCPRAAHTSRNHSVAREANNTCGTSDDVLLAPSSQTFNFGHHFFTLSFKQLIHCFDVTVTAAMSRPQRVTFNPSAFPIGTEATKYSSKGSFAVEYLADSVGQPRYHYARAPDGVQTSALFFTLLSLESPPRYPGMAKNHDEEIVTGENSLKESTIKTSPNTSSLRSIHSKTQENRGQTTIFPGSWYLMVPWPISLPVQFETASDWPKPPVETGIHASSQVQLQQQRELLRPCGIPYSRQINDYGTQTPQPVVPKGNEIGNKFSSGSGGNFTYELDTSFLAVGKHQLIITSNRFAPRDGNDGNPALPNLDPAITVIVQP